LKSALVVSLIGILLLVLVLRWGLRRWVTQPLIDVAADLRQVADGDITHQIGTTGPAEIAQTAHDAEDMRRRLILEIDGQKVSSASEIHAIIARHKMGDALPVLVQRTSQSGSTQNLTFAIKLTPNEVGDPALGIYVQNSYTFPFTVKFNINKTGGPSGGLVFALGIIEKLTAEDLLKGRKIAGTGTIDSEGNVGPIGGITEKMIGASQAGATIFLAPAKNCVDIKQVPKNLLVIPVSTLNEAVTVLRNTRPEALAGCR
ncbi:MAG: hypothetical protein RJB28_50, partial [Actinomycetota bacterium]